DQTRDEVRVMTVHAAKGLEAPVVFLVDGGSAPFSDQHLPRLMPFQGSGRHWTGKGYLWRSASDVANGFSKAAAARARELADDEYRRLLYVGMTRARDDLHLLVPQRFFTHNQAPGGDRHVYAARTRFIPTGLLPLFELASWPVAVPSEGPRAAGPAVDIGARLRRRWQAPHSVQDDFDLASLGD
ncbi:MAG: 3'-5' exonuclease, partial [Ferrovibrionaceae bacterium]